jgi:hypothetical protein
VVSGFLRHYFRRPLFLWRSVYLWRSAAGNLFVELATILLGGYYANILMFHIAMQPVGIASDLIVSIAVKTVLPGTQCRA